MNFHPRVDGDEHTRLRKWGGGGVAPNTGRARGVHQSGTHVLAVLAVVVVPSVPSPVPLLKSCINTTHGVTFMGFFRNSFVAFFITLAWRGEGILKRGGEIRGHWCLL